MSDSDFILTARTSARAITADVRIITALAADFKKNITISSFHGNKACCRTNDSAATCCEHLEITSVFW